MSAYVYQCKWQGRDVAIKKYHTQLVSKQVRCSLATPSRRCRKAVCARACHKHWTDGGASSTRAGSAERGGIFERAVRARGASVPRRVR